MSKVQCCGLCRYHKYMALGEFVCDNEDSECYGLSTHYDDVCEEDFKEKWKNTMEKRKENSEEKADYTFDTLEEITEAELENLEKMKTLWYIEQDPQKKRIEVYPGSDGCISLPRVQEAEQFIKILEKAIQETFSL